MTIIVTTTQRFPDIGVFYTDSSSAGVHYRVCSQFSDVTLNITDQEFTASDLDDLIRFLSAVKTHLEQA